MRAGVKVKKRRVRIFRLSFKNYWINFKKAFFSPQNYAERVLGLKDIKTGISFLIINISLGLVLHIIYKIILNKNWSLVFPAISETLFLIPMGVLALLIFACFLHVWAKVFGGKGSLKQSIAASCFASLPFVFLFLPYIWVGAFLWTALLMVLTFQKVHNYKYYLAIINVTLPFLMIMLFLIMLGIINPEQIISRLTLG